MTKRLHALLLLPPFPITDSSSSYLLPSCPLSVSSPSPFPSLCVLGCWTDNRQTSTGIWPGNTTMPSFPFYSKGQNPCLPSSLWLAGISNFRRGKMIYQCPFFLVSFHNWTRKWIQVDPILQLSPTFLKEELHKSTFPQPGICKER